MIDNVLDSIVDAETEVSFHGNLTKLQDYFKNKYDSIADHTSFSFLIMFLPKFSML